MKFSAIFISLITLILLFSYNPASAQADLSGPESKSKPREMAGNIYDLLEDEVIEVEVVGNHIDSVIFRLRRRTNETVTVIIPPGTYLDSESSSIQNMVVTNSRIVELSNSRWYEETATAACGSLMAQIPGNDDVFTVLDGYTDDLTTVMEFVDEYYDGWEYYHPIQAAVWIVTLNANYEYLGILVDDRDRRLLNADEAGEAMWMVDEAGVDIERKSIWRDRHDILRRLSDDYIADWLRVKMAN